MNTLKSLFSFVSLAILVVGMMLGLILGYWIFRERQNTPTQVTSRVVVERVSKQGFLVTRSVFLDQKVELKVDKGSDWSNFWWGQTITASAMTKVDVGVDLTQIGEQQVHLDTQAKKICLVLPSASVQDVTTQGDIAVKTKQGILKTLLANNPNQDFNQAKAQIEHEARDVVEARPIVLDEASAEVVTLLGTLFKDTGYSVASCSR